MDYPYVMRQATLDDLDTVMSIVGERTDWLRERGSDQWSGGSVYDRKFVRLSSVTAVDCYPGEPR